MCDIPLIDTSLKTQFTRLQQERYQTTEKFVLKLVCEFFIFKNPSKTDKQVQIYNLVTE